MAKEQPNPLLEDDWEEISTGIGEEWDFDKNKTLMGTYKGTEYIDIPEEKQRDGRTRAMTYQFETAAEGATVFVWESYQLKEAMSEVTIGDLVRIQFDGYKKFDGSDGPRQVKQFKISVKRSK
ncbi:MAG: hypothetical protein ACHQ1H_01290 [Nitrososphaerales archaeon]